MLGGEEQYLFGLLDHDGKAGRKYYEFRQIAEEFKKIGQYGLPRKTKPDIAMAYSYESLKVSLHEKSYYQTEYIHQLLNTYKPFFHSNLDCNIIDLRNVKNKYKIIFIPGYCLMDPDSAKTIRNYVECGGTVVMTAYSAKVNENNQVFDTAMPGLLSDVFGVRVNAFERTGTHVGSINEGGLEKHDMGIIREKPGIALNGTVFELDIDYYEIIELHTASTLAYFTDIEENRAAISINKFGKGMAIYIAVPAKEKLMDALLNMLCARLDIEKGPETPQGVVARRMEENRILYINTMNQSREILQVGTAKSLLTGKIYHDKILLDPYEVDFIVSTGSEGGL
jgi:beta-galactosidase